jgi:hypothetical protein
MVDFIRRRDRQRRRHVISYPGLFGVGPDVAVDAFLRSVYIRTGFFVPKLPEAILGNMELVT